MRNHPDVGHMAKRMIRTLLLGICADYLMHMTQQGYGQTMMADIPLTQRFIGLKTTDFSSVQNIRAVRNLTLATEHGLIRFTDAIINAEGQDYDSDVRIGQEFVSVDTARLDESFNSNAQVLLVDVD